MEQLSYRFAIPHPLIRVIFEYADEDGEEYKVAAKHDGHGDGDGHDADGDSRYVRRYDGDGNYKTIRTTLATELCSDEKERVFFRCLFGLKTLKYVTCRGCHQVSFKQERDWE